MYIKALVSALALHEPKSSTLPLLRRNDTGPAYQPPALDPVAGSISVVNSCTYAVTLRVESPGCAHVAPAFHVLQPHTDYTSPINKTACAGYSWKIAKGDNVPDDWFGKDNVTQLEFGYSAEANMVSYDLSIIDCKEGKCPAYEAGLQVVAGLASERSVDHCQSYACPPSANCSTQMYMFHENDSKPNPPVGGCGPDGGLIYELCTSTR